MPTKLTMTTIYPTITQPPKGYELWAQGDCGCVAYAKIGDLEDTIWVESPGCQDHNERTRLQPQKNEKTKSEPVERVSEANTSDRGSSQVEGNETMGEWEERFDKDFCYSYSTRDGVFEVLYTNRAPEVFTQKIKDFIQQEIESAHARGREEEREGADINVGSKSAETKVNSGTYDIEEELGERSAQELVRKLSYQETWDEHYEVLNEFANCLVANIQHRVAKNLVEYTQHDDDCILSKCHGGRPTKGGGFERNFDCNWYQLRPVDQTPKCTCGLDDLLSTYLTPTQPREEGEV